MNKSFWRNFVCIQKIEQYFARRCKKLEMIIRIILIFFYCCCYSLVSAFCPNGIRTKKYLVNYITKGNYNYYGRYVSINDLRQEAILSMFDNQNLVKFPVYKEDPIIKNMHREVRRYGNKQTKYYKKTSKLYNFKVNLYYETNTNIQDFVVDDSNLDPPEKKIVALLLQNKKPIEIMDECKLTFPLYKKYIHLLRRKLQFRSAWSTT